MRCEYGTALMDGDRLLLPIGQVARSSGVNVQTVRYYERRGLIASPARRPSGQRAYEPNAVTLLRALKTAQRLGFTLTEIDEILHLSRNQPQRGNAVHARIRDKIIEIDDKMADLNAMRERLIAALHAGCDSLTSCACPSSPMLAEAGERARLRKR